MAILNLIWAALCLAGLSQVAWRQAELRRRGTAVLGMILLAGLLFPVISADDNAALLRLQVSQATLGSTSYSRTGRQTQLPAAETGAANFWLVFNHLNAAAPPANRHEPERRATVGQRTCRLLPASPLRPRNRAPPDSTTV